MGTKWLLVGGVKLRKGRISFVMSVCPSERTEQLGAHWTEFHDSWYLNIIWTAVREIHVQRSCDSNTTVFHDDWRIFCVLFRSAFIVRGNVSEKISREIKHILWQKCFFRKSWQLRYNAENTVAYCEVWLRAEELLIKDQRLRKCPRWKLPMIKYAACR